MYRYCRYTNTVDRHCNPRMPFRLRARVRICQALRRVLSSAHSPFSRSRCKDKAESETELRMNRRAEELLG